MSKDKLKLSYSSMRTYKECPKKYFLSRKWRSKLTTSAFPFGTAVEHAITSLVKDKDYEKALDVFENHWHDILEAKNIDYYSSDLDMNLYLEDDKAQLQEWAKELFGKKADWKKELSVAIADAGDPETKKTIPKKNLDLFNKACWLACAIRGMYLIKAFKDEILPQIEEIIEVKGSKGIQHKIRMENEDGDAIEGYPDYLFKVKGVKEPVILDLKTASSLKYYDDHALDTSDQLKTYAAGLWKTLGKVKVGYAVLVKKIANSKSCSSCNTPRPKGSRAQNCKVCKDGKYDKLEFFPEAKLFIKDLQERELDDTLEEYRNIGVAIKNDIVYRNPGNCKAYNRKCEFYDVCWKNKKPEEDEGLEPKKK